MSFFFCFLQLATCWRISKCDTRRAWAAPHVATAAAGDSAGTWTIALHAIQRNFEPQLVYLMHFRRDSIGHQLLHAEFGHGTNPDELLLLERESSTSALHDCIRLTTLIVANHAVSKASRGTTVVQLPGSLLAWSKHPLRDIWAFACQTASTSSASSVSFVFLFEVSSGRLWKTKGLPARIVTMNWIGSAALLAVVCSRAELHIFDLALQRLRLSLYRSESDESSEVLSLSGILPSIPFLRRMVTPRPWISPRPDRRSQDIALWLLFDDGLCGVVSLTMSAPSRTIESACEHVGTDAWLHHDIAQLVQLELDSNRGEKAVQLLLQLNWSSDADACFDALGRIVGHLLATRYHLSAAAETQVEGALGAFYSPALQIVPDAVVLFYRDRVRHLARRFFFALLHSCRLDKAYLLACDMEEIDMFRALLGVLTAIEQATGAAANTDRLSRLRVAVVSKIDEIVADMRRQRPSLLFSSAASPQVARQRSTAAGVFRAVPAHAVYRQPSPSTPAVADSLFSWPTTNLDCASNASLQHINESGQETPRAARRRAADISQTPARPSDPGQYSNGDGASSAADKSDPLALVELGTI